ncbi:hypothetical protein [Varibaculum cambriense]|uniref:hypothetical protein n=1 Tax=Varibaculum cambriense TaxID=184870 RepID=UPI00241C9432|nr:hypothetical protein [Varibaculum cambriense]MBS5944896.1 hypothetical protein [Varibaculum cambriense]
MLRNKDRQLTRKARTQSEQIAFRVDDTDRAAGQLRTAGQDFAHWLDDLDDERLIEKIPNLTERLDYIYTRTVNVQKAVVNTILEIHAMRETLEKLDTRKINREKEEGGEC